MKTPRIFKSVPKLDKDPCLARSAIVGSSAKALFSIFLFFVSIALSNAQTITWTAAGNPHVVSGTYTVPTGQTLVMEAGVIVNLQANSTFQIDGQLIGNGTGGNHITINGAAGTVDVRGTTDLKFTDIHAFIAPDSDGVLLFADCKFFPDGGYIYNGSILQADNSRAPYLQFDRCAFLGDTTTNSASLYLAYVTVVLRNTTFTNGSFCSVYPGYLFVDGVSSDRSAQFGLALGSDSDLFLNNISVTNAKNEGLKLAGDTRNGSNVLIGPNVTLQANEYPVHLTVAGLYPASAIPSTGNQKNLIHASGSAGNGGYWPKFAIPYYVDGSPLTVGNGLRILPGVTVKMAPFSYINDIGFADGMRAFGTKDQPIMFQRADPAQSWYDIHSDRTEGGRMRHVIVEGNTDGVNGGEWRLENCIFRNNDIGTSGDAIVTGSQYLNNGTGNYAYGTHNSPTNPNSFEGNGIGVYYSTDARNCWWGSASGPTTPNNPGGTGDRVDNQLTPFTPFLHARPSYADAPPEVKMRRPAFQLTGGSKITISWASTDDVGIASHKILFSAVGNTVSSFQTLATLPGNQRTYELTVPNIGFTTNGANAFVKVVAVDTSGKETFDEAEVVVPTNNVAGEVQFNITAGETLNPGQMRNPIYTQIGMDQSAIEHEFYLEDVRGETRKLTGRGRGGLPFFSTDTARFVVAFGYNTNDRKYWYSPFFKIRPDSHLNDAPPTVSLNFPQAGNAFAPGTVVPISWIASDDEGLRAFDILASYDAARTWQPIAQDLPGTARNFDWQTAPGSGFTNVRLMVIAKDWRFQTSSDGAARSFAIAGSAVTPTNVVSRKTHGTAGTFDITLPLTGNAGIECRSGGANSNYQVVFTFPTAVTLSGASAGHEAGKFGSVVGTPGISPDGRTVTLNLTNVTTAQTITGTLLAVNNGTATNNVTVRMAVLTGDTNLNGLVNASDISLIKSQSGHTITSVNFGEDVTADGNINASDIGFAKSRSGSGIAMVGQTP